MPPSDTSTFDLALVLTAAGATVAAALITGLIEIIKKLPGVGPALDAGNEPAVAFIFSALLVVVAYVATAAGVYNVQGAFAAFLAWYGIAQISMGVHDNVASLRS